MWPTSAPRPGVATRGDLLVLSQRLVREMRGQFGSGLTDSRDFVEAQGNVNEARVALLQAQAELAEHRDALQIYFVGLPSITRPRRCGCLRAACR